MSNPKNELIAPAHAIVGLAAEFNRDAGAFNLLPEDIFLDELHKSSDALIFDEDDPPLAPGPTIH